MLYFKRIYYLVFFSIIFLMCACTNTRIIIEGTKKVLEKTNPEKKKKESATITTTTAGHYKVGNAYIVDGIEYKPMLLSKYNKTGIASWYGPNFHNKITANGEIFDQNSISAAHKILPLPSVVKVINTSNSQFLYVRVNDRGPFVNDRIIDLSKKAAKKLNFFKKGTTEVNVILIDSGPHLLDKKFLNHNYLSNYAKLIDDEGNSFKKINTNIILQIGVFSSKKNAYSLLNYLKTKINDNLFIQDYSNVNKGILYKVFVGPFIKEDKANAVSSELLNLGYSTIFVKSRE